jgi:pentatricopeptide repeat protein
MSSSSTSAVLQLLRRLEAQNVWARASSSLSGGLGTSGFGRDEGSSSPRSMYPFSQGLAGGVAGGSASTVGVAGLGSGLGSVTQAGATGSLSALRSIHARQASSSSSSSSSSLHVLRDAGGRKHRALQSSRSSSPENQRYLLHSRSAWVAFMSTVAADEPGKAGGVDDAMDDAGEGAVEDVVDDGVDDGVDEVEVLQTIEKLTTRITEMGPIKQRQLQQLYSSCASVATLEKAAELTRLNYLARGELHQHGPFSNKTCLTLLQQAMRLGALDIAKDLIVHGAQYGFGEPSTRQYNMLLIYYSKQGLLKEIVEMYEMMKVGGPMPDSETCFILVKSFVDASRVDVARAIVSEFEKAGVRVRDGARLYIDQHE